VAKSLAGGSRGGEKNIVLEESAGRKEKGGGKLGGNKGLVGRNEKKRKKAFNSTLNYGGGRKKTRWGPLGRRKWDGAFLEPGRGGGGKAPLA